MLHSPRFPLQLSVLLTLTLHFLFVAVAKHIQAFFSIIIFICEIRLMDGSSVQVVGGAGCYL